MKRKYPNLFGILAALMLVVSFVVPTSLVSPASVAADPGICKWDTLKGPNAFVGANQVIFNDIIDMSVASDFSTVYLIAVVSAAGGCTANAGPELFKSTLKGFGPFCWMGPLLRSGLPATNKVYQVATAPDDAKFVVVTSDNGTPLTGPKEVWVSTNSASTFARSNLAINLGQYETIRSIDVSADYGGVRDIVVGTATGLGGTSCGRIFVVKSTGFSGWTDQLVTTATAVALSTINLGAVDIFAVKFSPTYASDASIAVVYADNVTVSTGCPGAAGVAGGTFFNVAFRDIAQNRVSGWASAPTAVEVRDTSWAVASSPGFLTLNKADLELPSDFSGQAASLRRAYISLDASVGSLGACPTAKLDCDRDGIFRIDDTTVYTLMDTHSITDKSIYSIAYFGTYASGKLLAGERFGYPCTATVPTWFTDSPTTCPIPCWYPALKPTTGAACLDGHCAVNDKCGVGAALVAWAPPGTLAYAATGSLAAKTSTNWWGNFILARVSNDESALAISRNNGETWNQIALIDTTITKLTDVAPAPDCKTVYLASVSATPDATGCCQFDSVWRTSTNGDVVSPIGVAPLGVFWERVFTHVTAPDCTYAQKNVALLRLVPYCADPTGEIVAWAVYDSAGTYNPGVAAWSPDFGDYWAMLTPRNAVQDFCFESRTVMYFLSPGGLVQRMPYLGTAWSTAIRDINSSLVAGHTIAAYPEGIVLVGTTSPYNAAVYAVCLLTGMNTDTPTVGVKYLCGNTGGGNVHVAFDPNYKDNSTYYIATGSSSGAVFRNSNKDLRWQDVNMMSAMNGAVGCYTLNQYGIVLAQTGQALYSAYGCSAAGAAGGGQTVTLYVNAAPSVATCNVTATTSTGAIITWINVPAAVGSVTPTTGAATSVCAITSVTVTTASTTGFAQITGSGGAQYVTTVNLATGAYTLGANTCTLATAGSSSGVNRTIDDGTGKFGPLSGMPKPGIAWDRLTTGLTSAICFTLEPSSLKICGCCTLDTDSTLYAIDDASYVPGSTGEIWAFTDCMAKKGPALVTEDKALIGCDPVSGRAQEVNLCWEQLCLANAYDIEIAKSAEFTIKIIDWAIENTCDPNAFLFPADVQVPCVYFPAGGEAYLSTIGSAIAAWGNLECGHTYYWRVKVRECATTQVVRSPWSEVRSFTVKAGLPVVSTYLGLTLLAPNNGCLGCPVQPVSFSWSPFKETTKYKFQLASDAGMTQLVKEAEVLNSTAYEFDGALDYSTNYFWRVMSMEPAPSDWSATFSFQTEAKPAEAAGAAPVAPTPLWVWVVIAIGAILVIVTLVLIFKTRRV